MQRAAYANYVNRSRGWSAMKAFFSRFLKNRKSDITLDEYIMIAVLIFIAIRVGAHIFFGKQLRY